MLSDLTAKGVDVSIREGSYANTLVEVNDDYSFSLSFWGEKNQLATIDVAELKTVVEQIKPAHLRFVISGITWADLESVNMTWKYFEDNPTTWAQLESMFCIHAKE